MWREETATPPIASEDPSIHAIITDSTAPLPAPVGRVTTSRCSRAHPGTRPERSEVAAAAGRPRTVARPSQAVMGGLGSPPYRYRSAHSGSSSVQEVTGWKPIPRLRCDTASCGFRVLRERFPASGHSWWGETFCPMISTVRRAQEPGDVHEPFPQSGGVPSVNRSSVDGFRTELVIAEKERRPKKERLGCRLGIWRHDAGVPRSLRKIDAGWQL